MMRLRFAPSPTGLLHVGNARTALFNWLMARGAGGTFVLRVEDTDVERSTRQSEAGIIEDLRWLGLDWDEGPDVGGSRGPYRQSERLALYQSYADRLIRSGTAYYCFCSAEALEAERAAAIAANRAPKYPGTCRQIASAEAGARLGAGERAAVRFRVSGERDVVFADLVRGEVRVHTSIIGDPVLLRSDGTPAYNFAVVIDDALMGITHVVRGEDHVSNTPRQLLLYEALGLEPPAFAHVSLVLGPDHAPLSKRHGATSVAEFRARGYLPEALVNYLALIGWSPGGDEELLPIGELARRFSVADVGRSAGVFDPAKLAWANRHYLRLADPVRIAGLAVPYLAGGWERDIARRRWSGVSGIDHASRIGRRGSARGTAGTPGVPLRLRRAGGTGQAGRAGGAVSSRRSRGRRRTCRGIGAGRPGRSGTVPGRCGRRAPADRAVARAAVPPDPRRADG